MSRASREEIVGEKVQLSDEAAASRGVQARHEQMENGELRFRLTASDGSAYIRTVSTPYGAWQNSHYHNSVLETYIVQKGWVVFVELLSSGLSWQVMRQGDVYTTKPSVSHNLYVPADTILHTVKHGETHEENDWHSSPELDAETKSLSEAELEKMLAIVR